MYMLLNIADKAIQFCQDHKGAKHNKPQMAQSKWGLCVTGGL